MADNLVQVVRCRDCDHWMPMPEPPKETEEDK